MGALNIFNNISPLHEKKLELTNDAVLMEKIEKKINEIFSKFFTTALISMCSAFLKNIFYAFLTSVLYNCKS